MSLRRMVGLSTALTLSVGLGAGCGPEGSAAPGHVATQDGSDSSPDSTSSNPLASGLPFVAIARDVQTAEQSARQDALNKIGLRTDALRLPKTDFYVAVHKSALNKKWFLNAFLNNQISTDSLASQGAQSLGTDVVELKVQNGKLYVFSADDRKKWSDSFDPEVIIEAYPIVETAAAFGRLGGSDQYILVDPTRGLNNFALTWDYATNDYPDGTATGRLKVDLAYSQNFTQLKDGVAFEMVIAGSSEAVSQNDLSITNAGVAMTMTLSFREYSEGEGFVSMPAPEAEHYFLAPRRVITDQSTVASPYALKWNVHAGMKPIEWLITPNAVDLAAKYGNLDLVGALTRGIESWNKVFGFTVFKARLAAPNEKLGRDDLNFMVVDSDVGAGAAFASPRANPQTGEIRGASVYFPAAFFADNSYEDDAQPAPDAPLADNSKHKPSLRVSFAAMPRQTPNCALTPGGLKGQLRPKGTLDQDNERTKEEKLLAAVQETVAHEVGHTLGLRHNFKGSLLPPSSTVMDYNRGFVSIEAYEPGPYDYEAIHYLYGISDVPPASPFCTDNDLGVDPTCMQFDFGADPLVEAWAPSYAQLVSIGAQIGTVAPLAESLDVFATPMLSFLRAGESDKANQAFDLLTQAIAAPLDPALAADPGYAGMADSLTQWLLTRIYLLPPEQRGGAVWRLVPINDPSDPAVVNRITEQLSLMLINEDSVRSFQTRRMIIDVLRSLQSTPALRALLSARAVLEAAVEAGTLEADAALLTDDLVRRIDAATSPYFD